MQDFKPLLRKLTGGDHVLVTNRLFIEYTGSHIAGLFLQQLLYWQGKYPDSEFYKTAENWCEEIVINKKTFFKIKKQFEAQGWVKTVIRQQNGVPTNFWRVDENAIYTSLLNYVNTKNGTTDSTNSGTVHSTNNGTTDSTNNGTVHHYNNIEYSKENKNIEKEKAGKPKKAQPAQTEKASYVWQAEKNNAAGLEEIKQHCINEASKSLTEVYYKHTGKHITLEDARKWIEVCAIGKNFDIQKTTFNPDGSVSNCPLTQWLLNSAKKAIEEGRFTIPKAAVKAKQNTNNQIL